MLFNEDISSEHALFELTGQIAVRAAPAINPLPCDRWVARSVIQKAIRRAKPDLAQRALANLFEYDRRSTWRHLVIIALEDVGVANVGVLRRMIAAQRDRQWREQVGGDWPVMAELVRQMAVSTHCQAACDFLLRTIHDLKFEVRRTWALDADNSQLARLLQNTSEVIEDRGLAALALAGNLADGQFSRDPHAVFDILSDTGRSSQIAAVGRAAWRLSRNPMALLLPLVWETWVAEGSYRCESDPMPPAQMLRGVPAYALDQFTRVGNTISRKLVSTDPGLKRFLADAHVLPAAHSRIVGDLLFLIEGGLLANRAIWSWGDRLRLPHRALHTVATLAGKLDEGLIQMASKDRQLAQLRQQYFYPLAL